MAESMGGRGTGRATGWAGASRSGARWSGRRLGAVVVAATLLAAGCSGGDGAEEAAPDVPTVEVDRGSDASTEDALATVGVVVDLASQLQLETFWSAADAVGADGAREALDAQRARTDEALTAFRGVTGALPAGAANDLEAAELRLEQLDVVRRMVDDGQGTPLQRLGDYRTISAALVELVATMPQHSDDADDVRDLQLVGELARHTDASAGERAFLTLVVAEGSYARWDGDGAVVPCAGVPVADPGCGSAMEVLRAQADVEAASVRLTASAPPDLLQVLRDAQVAGGGFEVVNELVAAAQGRGAVADVVTLDEWMDGAPATLEALQAGQTEVLAQLTAG